MKFIKKYRTTIIVMICTIIFFSVSHFIIKPYFYQKNHIDNDNGWYQVDDFDYKQLEFHLYMLEKSHWKCLDSQIIKKLKGNISLQGSRVDYQYHINLFNNYEKKSVDHTEVISYDDTFLFDLSQYGFDIDKGIVNSWVKNLSKGFHKEQNIFQISHSIAFDLDQIDVKKPWNDINLDDEEQIFIITVTFQ